MSMVVHELSVPSPSPYIQGTFLLYFDICLPVGSQIDTRTLYVAMKKLSAQDFEQMDFERMDRDALTSKLESILGAQVIFSLFLCVL